MPCNPRTYGDRMRTHYKRYALMGTLTLLLAGCGGGGDKPDAGGSPVAPPATVTAQGVAASGAAFTGAVITVLDSRGVTVGQSQPVGTDGAYSIELDAAAVAPFVLVANRTDANGATQTLVSVIASASSTTANITPITTLIASRLSPSGDPAKLAGELAAGAAVILWGVGHRRLSFLFISFFSCPIFSCAVAFRKLLPVKRTGEHISIRRS